MTINSVVMNCPAWLVGADEQGQGGLLPLYYRFDKRGDNRIIPGGVGVIAYPKRVTETVVGLRLAVTGDVNSSGVVNADARAGLATNLKYIADNVVNHTASVVTASLALTGMTTISGDVQVIDMIEDRYNHYGDQSIWTGMLRINVVDGRLA